MRVRWRWSSLPPRPGSRSFEVAVIRLPGCAHAGEPGVKFGRPDIISQREACLRATPAHGRKQRRSTSSAKRARGASGSSGTDARNGIRTRSATPESSVTRKLFPVSAVYDHPFDLVPAVETAVNGCTGYCKIRGWQRRFVQIPVRSKLSPRGPCHDVGSLAC